MIVLPEIRATERNEQSVRFQLSLSADHIYFDGHFAEIPILPGVVQVGWAIELARKHLGAVGTFKAFSGVKFTRIIQPGSAVWLTLEYIPGKNQVDFVYEVDGRVCSSGSALFDA